VVSMQPNSTERTIVPAGRQVFFDERSTLAAYLRSVSWVNLHDLGTSSAALYARTCANIFHDASDIDLARQWF
jgi:hypothetical protein